ncbi:HIT family protein [Caldimonas thermodepolymerans]|uniref:HIT domain-containing protein n=1 Tax=Caldimonas thermodepolymerans TaxID=215580 RepID=A0A2S5T902_9BURK|nr:HIT family protein [Caldimonas thermodepolymerans]PPE71348.1 HIT domain-containing protein [Caldimonas thermodepolymerans]QPC32520.1 HIT family protein [Caldimonas thermodepolymerans]
MSVASPLATRPDCELCRSPGGRLILQTAAWRVVRVDDEDFPAFYRVIWQAHVAEWTDLDEGGQQQCMRAVSAIERVLRARLAPAKVNLATLGNVVPHLHWHVIARFDWDSHYPNPIWGNRLREVPGGARAALACPLETLDEAVRTALQALPAG